MDIQYFKISYLEYLGPDLLPPPRLLLPEDISTLTLVPQQRLQNNKKYKTIFIIKIYKTVITY